MLTKQDISELLELTDWLETQPLKCAISGDITASLPHLRHWTSSAWASKRDVARVIYYSSGYGWRLHRNYKSKLAKFTLEINERAIAL